jgi:hypothetical protein
VIDSPIYGLLVQIGIEASKRSFPKDPFKFFDSLRTAANAGAIAVTDAYAKQLNRNAKQSNYPQGRIKVTLDAGLSPETLANLIKHATVSVYPKTGFVLRIPVSSNTTEISWDALSERMTALSNGPYLTTIMYEIIDDFLPSKYDAKNDYLFKAPDDHSYRVTLVRYEMFGDGRSEFVFNLIETLVPLTGGDPQTTLISSAIVMATQYRSLFIERDATYSIDTLEQSSSPDLLDKAKKIVRDLRRIHIESATLGLDDKDAVKKALGSPQQIDDWYAEWWPPVTKLEDAAQTYIDAPSDQSKAAFLETLRELVERTSKVNRQFTSLCLEVYKQIIDGSTDGEKD